MKPIPLLLTVLLLCVLAPIDRYALIQRVRATGRTVMGVRGGKLTDPQGTVYGWFIDYQDRCGKPRRLFTRLGISGRLRRVPPGRG